LCGFGLRGNLSKKVSYNPESDVCSEQSSDVLYSSYTLPSVTIVSAMAMADLLDHAAERPASKAVTAIKWNILHDAKHPIDGTPQSFIELFMRICTLCKLDPVLSAFLASEGTVVTSGITMYASSTRDALIDEALRNRRTTTKHVAGRIIFLPSLVSEHRNAIPATTTLPAHRTPVALTGGSSPMSSAPSYTITDLNADSSGRNFDEADTAPLAGEASARRPSAAPVLPTSSLYRVVAWILQRIQQDLGLTLHALRLGLIRFFMRICTLCKLDPALSALLESEGMVIASGVTLYASSTQDALIDDALRNQRTPTKHAAGRIVFLPSLIHEHRIAIQATAGSATLPARRTPAVTAGGFSPMSSVQCTILPHRRT